ncbi:SAM-dependent methyltransferase [Marinomonas sp. MED121]|uniref:class I SAM-dependent methyltransferase n=1 Tax=Marinomonas sp. MED121 TaxID=314277 RepID=UPI000069018D|nr:class I SAM-dependent methyltransferase [Marinomonas sp. MED121]EAQ64383.1 SAM-dependent methyltransferase [Marinomonas sp. MED121]
MNTNTEVWEQFYKKTLERKHHPRTEKAISIDNTALKRAVDCGCGAGADMVFLAEKGYQVFGFDQSNDAFDICHKRFEDISAVEVTQASFENFQFPESSLILANASLFFAKPESFDEIWTNLEGSLVSGGVFAGDFMGIKDDWAISHTIPITSLTKASVMALFEGFDLIAFHERDELGQTQIGKSKHWHTYSVIAKKR